MKKSIKEYTKELFEIYIKGAHFTYETLLIDCMDVHKEQKEGLLKLCNKLKNETEYKEIIEHKIFILENKDVRYSDLALELCCIINGDEDMLELLAFEKQLYSICEKYGRNEKHRNGRMIKEIKIDIINKSNLFTSEEPTVVD